MPPFRARRAARSADHDCDYRDAIRRVQIALEQAQESYGRNAPVNAARIADLLNPHGMWRFIETDTEPMAKVTEEDTADLDPITGCKPVTARPQTGLDKVQAAVDRSRGGPPPPPVQGYA